MKPMPIAGPGALPSARLPFRRKRLISSRNLAVPFFKIASMDVVHLPLLKYVARKQRPVVISTGMATLAEIEQAVETFRAEGNEQIVLLHCVSIYPPEYDTIHLRNMATLQQAFDVPVGFSDHTLGTAIPLAAISLGACVIEKHFTLDQEMAGWDHAISANPEQLRTIVVEGRNIFQALGESGGSSARRRWKSGGSFAEASSHGANWIAATR